MIPESPEGKSVRDNVAFARQSLLSVAMSTPGLETTNLAVLATQALTFEAMVRPGGPWDYKSPWPDKSPPYWNPYDAFGNYVFGAAGAAFGFNLGTLLNMSGYVEANDDQGKPLTMTGMVRAFYGYDQYTNRSSKDVLNITAGYQDYRKGCPQVGSIRSDGPSCRPSALSYCASEWRATGRLTGARMTKSAARSHPILSGRRSLQTATADQASECEMACRSSKVATSYRTTLGQMYSTRGTPLLSTGGSACGQCAGPVTNSS
jgi:hypothetical protein